MWPGADVEVVSLVTKVIVAANWPIAACGVRATLSGGSVLGRTLTSVNVDSGVNSAALAPVTLMLVKVSGPVPLLRTIRLPGAVGPPSLTSTSRTREASASIQGCFEPSSVSDETMTKSRGIVSLLVMVSFQVASADTSTLRTKTLFPSWPSGSMKPTNSLSAASLKMLVEELPAMTGGPDPACN